MTALKGLLNAHHIWVQGFWLQTRCSVPASGGSGLGGIDPALMSRFFRFAGREAAQGLEPSGEGVGEEGTGNSPVDC